MSIRIYYPSSAYNADVDRRQVFPLLKPFLKAEEFTDEERKRLYGLSESDFSITTNLEEAEVILLPMSWNYYYLNGKLVSIRRKLDEIKGFHKPVCIVMTGDYGYPFPWPDVWVLRQSGMKKKLKENHLGMPVFIQDPLKRLYQQSHIFLRSYQDVPTVGFCGQASGNKITACREVFRTFLKMVSHHLSLYKPSAQPIQSTNLKRFRLLERLASSIKVKTNFIIRKKHGGGIHFGREGSVLEKEFFDNMVAVDYVLCYRGAGNFSVRFYETLAMGRIPIFVNTDCMLPLEQEINWKRHVVWVEANESHKIVDKVLAFHENLNPVTFEALQKANRELWETKLQLRGYFETLLPSLKSL